MLKTQATIFLKSHKKNLTRKQYKTLARQIQANEAEEAIKELRATLLFGGSNALK